MTLDERIYFRQNQALIKYSKWIFIKSVIQITISSFQGGRRPPTITEDNEGNPHLSVSRTLTQMDPEGKAERDV